MKAGVLAIRGPVGNENDTCTAGFACPVGPFTGTDLNLTDHIGFVPTLSNAVNFGNETCGSTRFDYHENIAPTQPIQVTNAFSAVSSTFDSTFEATLQVVLVYYSFVDRCL